MRAVDPQRSGRPSTETTLMASMDGSTWYTPVVPSAQVALSVFGWFTSGPRPARPLSKVPESQVVPMSGKNGTLRDGSYEARPFWVFTGTTSLRPTFPDGSYALAWR